MPAPTSTDYYYYYYYLPTYLSTYRSLHSLDGHIMCDIRGWWDTGDEEGE